MLAAQKCVSVASCVTTVLCVSVVLCVSMAPCGLSTQAKLMGALLVCLDAAVSFHVLH